MQHSLHHTLSFTGVGLHSGQTVALHLHPAPADHGILFQRSDLPTGQNIIPALWNHVRDTRLCTVVANDFGAQVGTIEHLAAALRGCHIDNALIELDGPEVPIMDGSAAPFVEAIETAGRLTQNAPRHMIKILKTIVLQDGEKLARLSPASESIFSGEIDFPHPAIGRQTYQTSLNNGNFAHLLANSRTFGFKQEVEKMRANGLARGGSLENAIVIGENSILNPEGLRHHNEFIRHKLLDAIGDLYLAGAPIIGSYHGLRCGHAMNNQLLNALFADQSAWTFIEDEPAAALINYTTTKQRKLLRA